ncbi:hypothetical protein [Anaerocolumna xylanovorans]|uniref:Uncharacterized protein n=1 Tax=Anaerocolumna xylanovorans DSM 12503 TaxID=1121345 RepID=A0A1M7YEE4_9FIRM|nr:hypothetical protein [Anaerocolumna xylanovorans]SHO50983.1 hypothetical protein SAMN02745217_03000 [Anaerocolumna xylanovorans DSM 12503]
MKYFEYDLWMDTNNEIDSKRQAALEIWEERARLYVEEYLEAKKYLSKAFIKAYEGNFGFRGCYLSGLLLSGADRKGVLTCKLLLSDLVDSWQLTYSGLEALNYHPAKEEGPFALPSGYMTLEFSELLIVNEEKLSHEFLFSNGSTLLVHFLRVTVKKINQP